MQEKSDIKGYVELATHSPPQTLWPLFILFINLGFLYPFQLNKSLIAPQMVLRTVAMEDFWKAHFLICKWKVFKLMLIILIHLLYREFRVCVRKKEGHLKLPHFRTFRKEIAERWLINLIMVLFRSELQAIDFNFIKMGFLMTAIVTLIML